MNTIIKRSQAIEYVIIALAVLLFLGLWPTKIIHRNHSVGPQPTAYFITEGHFLDSVELVIDSRAGYSDDELKHRDEQWEQALIDYNNSLNYAQKPVWDNDIYYVIYDEYGNEICSMHYDVPDNVPERAKITMPVRVDVGRGYAYYFTIKGAEAPILYNYQVYFVAWQYMVMALIMIICAAVACYVVHRLFQGTLARFDKDITVQLLLKWSLTPVILGLLLWQLIVIIVLRAYENRLTSIVFYSTGIVVIAAYSIFALWRSRTASPYRRIEERLENKKALYSKVQNVFQALCLSMSIWYCCEYWNGLYNIFHYYSTRRMLIWFLLAILVTFSVKELFSPWNLIWVVGASVFSYFYIKPYIGHPENELLYKLSAWVIAIGGLVIINIIRSLIVAIKAKKYNRLRLSVVIPVALLYIGLAVFNNTHIWVFVAMSMVILLTIRLISWENCRDLSMNLCNGIILSFVWMVIYCLIHRPFNAYQLYRYAMYFHTVTVTAEYLTLIFAAVVVRFIVRYRQLYKAGEDHIVAAMWLEMVLLGSVVTYMIITLSRTGVLGMMAIILVAVTVYIIVVAKHRLPGGKINVWKEIARPVVMAIVTMVLLYFTTFSLQRIVPTYTRDVIYSDIEAGDELVYSHTARGSEKYISPKRWLYCFSSKMLGISESPEVRNKMADDYNKLVTKVFNKLGIPFTIDDMTGNVIIYNKKDSDKYILLSKYKNIVGFPMLLSNYVDDEEEDISNGRMDIFRYYIAEWNLIGHTEMEVPDANGGLIVHAHNSFLQAIHNHGLIVGIYLIFLGMYMCVRSSMIFVKKIDCAPYILISAMIIVGFAAAGMTEWMFHICNPMGWALFVGMVPLMCRDDIIDTEIIVEK